MKIFITQNDGTKNFSVLFKLTEEFIILADKDCPQFEYEGHISQIRRTIKKHFNPAEDALVLVGCPVNIGIATAAVIEKGGGKILKWDRQTKVYVPINI
jgi:hypothetical protein